MCATWSPRSRTCWRMPGVEPPMDLRDGGSAMAETIALPARPAPATPYISVVIPVYNEEANLPELLERIAATMATLGRPYEVVLVNDGSRDGSLRLLQAAAARDPRIVVVDFNRNY